MKNKYIHITIIDNVDLLKNRIRTSRPDIKQILEYDVNETGIKRIFFDIQSRPLIKIKRAFIIHNLFSGNTAKASKSISINKNPKGALKFLNSLLGGTDLQEFLENDLKKMDRNTYLSLGLDKIVSYTKRGRLEELLEIDEGEGDFDIQGFIDSHANDDRILFIIFPNAFEKKLLEDLSKKYNIINLIKEQKGFARQPVSASVKDYILDYAVKENIKIKDRALDLLIEWKSNNIDAVKSELIKINALLPSNTYIDEKYIMENTSKESSIEWFWLINEIFNTDFLRAYDLIEEIYDGKLNVQNTESDSFVFMLLPQMLTYLYHAILANEIRLRFALNEELQRGYPHFKANIFNSIAGKLKDKDMWPSHKNFNLMALHPYRVYQFFTWASRFSNRKLARIILKISELDILIKSSRINIKNNLFNLMAMVYF